MFKSKSLYQLILYSTFFIVLLMSCFTFIMVKNSQHKLNKEILTITKEHITNTKAILKDSVTHTLHFLDYFHNKYKNEKNQKEIQKEVLEALYKLRDEKTRNYIFIYTLDGTLIYHPFLKADIGKNFINKTSLDGEKTIQNIIQASEKKDGGFVKYEWFNENTKKDEQKISFAKTYKPWNWLVGKGIYLNEMEKIIKEKRRKYNENISNYTSQIVFLSVLLLFYSAFIYKNIKLLIVKDIDSIKEYFEDSNSNLNQNKLSLSEFKIISQYASESIEKIKDKSKQLEDVNKNLETLVSQKTQELRLLVESQKKFIKYSVHEINTPLSIIRNNIDLLKMKVQNNQYVTNIESGSKIIQYIYDDLSYLVKRDKIVYEKEYLNFSEVLQDRIMFFEEIAKSNLLGFDYKIEDEIYIKFNKIEMQRIIDNNLSNAIKYSFENSTIYIELFYIDDENIEFSIKTNSKPIENQEKIFNDFYRENLARGGFGLGLNIVKDICDKNFVIIYLKSNKDFTKFTYRFKINENTTT